MTDAVVRGMLDNIYRNIDLDTAITVAEVINLYQASLLRIAKRTTLTSEDAIRILHIIHQILDACGSGHHEEPIFPPGRPMKSDQNA